LQNRAYTGVDALIERISRLLYGRDCTAYLATLALVGTEPLWEELPARPKVLIDILVKDPRILAAPAPSVMVAELSKNGMQFALWAWSKTSDYEAVRGSVLERIKLTFDQHDLTIL
jgi:hypothetical protein